MAVMARAFRGSIWLGLGIFAFLLADAAFAFTKPITFSPGGNTSITVSIDINVDPKDKTKFHVKITRTEKKSVTGNYDKDIKLTTKPKEDKAKDDTVTHSWELTDLDGHHGNIIIICPPAAGTASPTIEVPGIDGPMKITHAEQDSLVDETSKVLGKP
jgi:hypothetical protein